MPVNWNLSLYKTGIEFMDDQHQQLYYALSSIREAYGKEDEESIILEVLDFLIEYADFHFKEEEDFMRKIAFEGYEYQRQEHATFIDNCNAMKKMLNDEGFSRKFIILLYNDVYKWLINHISEKDSLIAKFAFLKQS
ncbi:hemerythrin family protein [Herbivorax sp. ANBcel31]|uniref:bacteriohemerythrin n=1 Tax=Herbivorax sp. ANBcel31 TaxID=3069754 RepID=UPI0027B3C3B4|nr:hemerythrin family protein [Herbivorax sp. ANBcel31]MDQ2087831.1 hemerythrin family protein [Herbivorax sp. ANBcel31]